MLLKFEKGKFSGVEARKSNLYKVGAGEAPSGQRALWSSDLESNKSEPASRKKWGALKKRTGAHLTQLTVRHVSHAPSCLLGSVRDIK